MKQTVCFALAGALILAACAKEVVPAVVEEPNINNKTTIFANVPETKTTQDDGVFSWSENEAIAVGGDASSTTQFYDFTCTDTENGEFTGSATDARKVAISPSADASAFSIVGETFSYSLTLPESYAGYVSGTTNALMVGAPIGENKYQFNHAAALLKVTYKNAPVGTTGLSFTSANHNITGTKAGLTSATGVSVAIADMTGNTVTYTLATTLAAVSDLEFYIPVPVGEYANFAFNINLTGSDTIASSTSKTLKGTKTLEAGNILNLQAITLVDSFSTQLVGCDKDHNINDAALSFWNTRSSALKIQKGQTLHIDFTEYSTNSWTDEQLIAKNIVYEELPERRNWFNWNITIAKDKKDNLLNIDDDRYFVLRNDYYGWGVGYDASHIHVSRSGGGDFWDDYLGHMAGARVSMTIEYSYLNIVKIIANSVSSIDGSIVLTETYYQTVEDSDDIVYAYLICDHSAYDIHRAWLTDEKDLTTTSPLFVAPDLSVSLNDFGVTNLSYDFSGALKPITTDFTLSFPYAASLAGVGGNQHFSTVFNGSDMWLRINTKLGVSGVGDFLNYNWTLEDNWRTLSSSGEEESVTVYAYVYSKKTHNFSLPQINLDDETNYCFVRPDNYVSLVSTVQDTETYNDTAFNKGNDEKPSGGNRSTAGWTSFRNRQNHAKMTIEVINKGNNSVTVKLAINTADGEKYWQNYYNLIFASDKLRFKIGCDQCCAVIVSEEIATNNDWPEVN